MGQRGGRGSGAGRRGKSKHAFADLFEFLVVFHLGGSSWAARDRRMGIVEGRSSKSRRRLAMARRCWLLGRERVVLRGGGQRGAAKDQDNKGQGREGAGGKKGERDCRLAGRLTVGYLALVAGHWALGICFAVSRGECCRLSCRWKRWQSTLIFAVDQQLAATGTATGTALLQWGPAPATRPNKPQHTLRVRSRTPPRRALACLTL